MELSCKLNCGTGARIGGWTQAYDPICRPVESSVDRSVVVKRATCSASAWGRKLGGRPRCSRMVRLASPSEAHDDAELLSRRRRRRICCATTGRLLNRRRVV